ncbi:MAG: hypothetical protein H6737_26835 [Alphaproteobacteria bacterium]|nr:hypothetical protein [Alphaproteobacteria bacterium]
MAEMLRTPPRVAVDEATKSDAHVHFDEPVLIRSYTASSGPRSVPAGALAGAVSSWFAIVFAVCYLALPAIASVMGLYSGMLANLVPNTLALGLMGLVTTALAVVIRPKVVTNVRAARDPVIAATVGSLLMWAGGQELLPQLQALTAMPFYESLTFVGMNVVESSLFGMMLASFARTPAKAFALGAAFQALLLCLFVGSTGF